MTGSNLLFICSDEHARSAMGCSGHTVVQTPTLDRLAASGTRFTNAYTNSPICVPARASLATGRYVHQIGNWSSAEPYKGDVPGWGHRLIDDGHRVVSIGKLHYRDTDDPNGFEPEILPLHVVDGVGWMTALLRRDPPPAGDVNAGFARDVGAGETAYTRYDRDICAAACDWLKNDGARRGDTPWVLFVSFVCPHYPLVAPAEFHGLYTPEDAGWPRAYAPDQRPTHPVLTELARYFDYDAYFDDARVREARAAYYGLCSFLDDNVRKLLAALEDGGLAGETRIVYTADHGEMLGDHGFWAKSVMYDGAVAVPLIVAGPGVPAGAVIETPVSHVDCYPTIVESVGAPLSVAERALPGHSLIDIAEGATPDRTVLSEYHDGGAITGIFMVRVRRWKYVHYVGYAPQLFDLNADPTEENDLGESPDHAEVRAECEARLRDILDPEAVNDQAFADQARRAEALGGAAAIRARGDFSYTPAPGEAAAG